MTRRVAPITLVAAASVAVATGLALSLVDWSETSSETQVLRMFCAAGIKRPVEAIAKQYQDEFGIEIQLTYGGSGTLLSGLQVSRIGDLYLAGDDSYTATAQAKGIAHEQFAIATMKPVFGTAAGNPERINSWQDLLRPGIKIGLASPEAAAIGLISKKLASRAKLWTRLKPVVTVFKPTVAELANDLVIGAIDVAVIWDATAAQYPEITPVPIPGAEHATKQVSLCVLASSTVPTDALRFARYLSARDRGQLVFKQHGFTPSDSDLWAPKPELQMFCGAMLNQAIDKTVTAFEEREGVTITRIYNGCGILTAQMQSGSTPDAYFSCDESFLATVQDRFEPGDTISDNDIILLVQKGNPKQIHSVHDLVRKGLRIGLGHPKKSALGSLTARLLTDEKLIRSLELSGNILVESPTGDFLVNQLRTGSLDATLVYRSNATGAKDHLTVVPISGRNTTASQPYAIAKKTPYKQLLKRLNQALRSPASLARFQAQGFSIR